MLVVAITGEIGAGKSTVAKIFEGYDAIRLDADIIAKSCWKNEDILAKATKRWGILPTDEKELFKKIAQIIFSDSEEQNFANSLIHPETRRLLVQEIESIKLKTPDALIIVEIPLLFESGALPEWVDKTVFVTAPLEARLRRVSVRGWDEFELKKRERFFLTSDEKKQKADVVIENDNTFDRLKKRVWWFAEEWKKQAKTIERNTSLCPIHEK